MTYFLIVFILLFAFACAICQDVKGYCTDVVGLLLCLRAQDQLNALILKTNDSMPIVSLNCAATTVSDDYRYNIRAYEYFSTKNNQNCHRAKQIYETLVKKYQMWNYVEIDCETIDGVSSNASVLELSLSVFLLYMFFSYIH